MRASYGVSFTRLNSDLVLSGSLQCRIQYHVKSWRYQTAYVSKHVSKSIWAYVCGLYIFMHVRTAIYTWASLIAPSKRDILLLLLVTLLLLYQLASSSLQYGPMTLIAPASGHQVRCIPWVQMGTFNKEIGFLCGLKNFALNIFCGEYLQSSLHLVLQIWWKPLLWKICQ